MYKPFSSLSSLSLSFFIGERIDHRCAHDFSSESLYQKKKPIEIEKPFRRLGMQNEAFCAATAVVIVGILF